MGQSYIGAAILHHLEGYHVQSLDLATLVSDSSRTMEAACVQLFVEAKRHKPSILFIPGLLTWVQTVNDTVRMTIKGLLEGLEPSDPILLLAVVDGPLSDLPSDVRSWFGFGKGNRVVMTAPMAVSCHSLCQSHRTDSFWHCRSSVLPFSPRLSMESSDRQTSFPTPCHVANECLLSSQLHRHLLHAFLLHWRLLSSRRPTKN